MNIRDFYLHLALLSMASPDIPYKSTIYQTARFVMMVAFAVIAYGFYLEAKKTWAVVFGSLALLFQPFLKVALGSTVWNVVDVVVAVLLLVVWIKRK